PVDPPWTPFVIWLPGPVVVEPAPATVMEREPAPIPFARERPAPVGPDPATACFVGCEIHAHGGGVWTPHFAVALDVDPLAVAVERGVDFAIRARAHDISATAGIR